MVTRLQADYLVVGAGATGMAFTDTLVAESSASVVLVDRRHGPGGHWLDAYPFVRLHQPSACYGVASTPLGSDGPDTESPEEDFSERASGSEIVGYYDRVLNQKLLSTGRVEFHPGSEYLGGRRFRSLLTGEEYLVEADKVVDATRMQSEVPATTPPKFEVENGVAWIPVGELVRLSAPPERWAIIGAGKTAQDACLWLLDSGIDPALITWIRPRDPWLIPRRYFQPGRGVAVTFDGYSRTIEAAASATSQTDLFRRLENEGLLVRLDPTVEPETFRGATISDRELAQLRRITDVVRMGYVRRIERDRIVFDKGTIPTGPDRLHVDCTARGLSNAKPIPIFDSHRITPQQVRFGMVPLSGALVAHIEATRYDQNEKNFLCPPIQMPDSATDWLVMTLQSTRADHRWTQDEDMAGWLDGCRLNVTAGLRERMEEPLAGEALARFATHARGAVDNLTTLIENGDS